MIFDVEVVREDGAFLIYIGGENDSGLKYSARTFAEIGQIFSEYIEDHELDIEDVDDDDDDDDYEDFDEGLNKIIGTPSMDDFASAVLDSGIVDSIEDAEDFAADAYYVCEEYGKGDPEKAITELAGEIMAYCEGTYGEFVSDEKAAAKAESIFSMIFETNLLESVFGNKAKLSEFDYTKQQKLGKNSLGAVLSDNLRKFNTCKTKEDVLNLVKDVVENSGVIEHGSSEKAYNDLLAKISGARGFADAMKFVGNIALLSAGLGVGDMGSGYGRRYR